MSVANLNNGTREKLLDRLADAVESVRPRTRCGSAVDGAPAAGKTTLAYELAVVLHTGAGISPGPRFDASFGPGTTLAARACTR